MTHGDDDGVRMPPRIAPQQIVILPILRDEAKKQEVMSYCEALKADLQKEAMDGQPLRVKLDARDIASADKRWEWIKKGAPLLLEIGPRDIEGGKVCVTRRNQMSAGKQFIARDAFVKNAAAELLAIQKSLFAAALAFRKARTVSNITDWKAFEAYFKKDDDNGFTGEQGFVIAKWSGDPASLEKLAPLGVTVRCIPFEQSGTKGACVLTGAPATQEVIFARAY